MIFGYSLPLALGVFFVIWWIVLFAVLPFGVKTQAEAGDVVSGSASSAPQNPRLLRKAGITTLLAVLVFALFIAITRSGFSIRDIPLPGFDQTMPAQTE